jgi:hypothetical protein
MVRTWQEAQDAIDLIQRDVQWLAAEPSERLAFDDDTHIVTLDGTPHHVANPKAYAVYQAIVERDDATITKGGIQARVKGVAGQKTIPNLIDALPRPVRQTVKQDTTGFWHELPA